MKLDRVEMPGADCRFQQLVVGVDEHADALDMIGYPPASPAATSKVRWRGEAGKKTKPTWLAPPPRAASSVAGDVNPQILAVVGMIVSRMGGSEKRA